MFRDVVDFEPERRRDAHGGRSRRLAQTGLVDAGDRGAAYSLSSRSALAPETARATCSAVL